MLDTPIMTLTEIMYSYLVNGWMIVLALLSPETSTQSSPSDLAALLGPLLSKDATVFLPGTTGFANGTETLAAKKPQLDLLVKVATAEDVQTTVCGATSAAVFAFPAFSLHLLLL